MARKSWITGLLWMVVAVFAAGFTAAPKAARTAKPAQQQAITISPAQNTPAHVYGAFWQVGPGYSTTLILKNKDRQKPLAVNLVLFSSNGQSEKTASVQVGPNATRRVELANLIKPTDDAVHGGGLALEFDAAAVGLAGQAVINSTANGSSVSLPLGGGYQWDNENALQAPWWLADGNSQASLRLFNSSSQAIVVTPSVTVEGAEQTGAVIGLAAHESKQVSLRDLLAQSKTKSADLGAVTLRYNGPGHALQPALLLGNNSGLWLAPGFQAHHRPGAAVPPVPRIKPGPFVSPVADQGDPGTGAEALRSTQSVALPRQTLPGTGIDPVQPIDPANPSAPTVQQTRWQFPEVKLQWAGSKDPLRAYALLTNGTNASMAVLLKAYFPAIKVKAIMQQAQLPVADLAPQETRLVDLSQFVENGTIPGKPAHVALVAGHTGAPGDLGISVFSVTPGRNQAFTAAGAILPAAVTDVSYWQIRGKIGSPQGVRNADDTQVQAQMVLYYPSPLGVGSYTLPAMTLAGHQEKTARMGHVARIPDERGAMAPVETRAGLAAVVAMAPGNNQPLLVDQTATCDRECGLITPTASNVAGDKTVRGTGVTDSTAPGGAAANGLIIIVTYHYHVYFIPNININFYQNCYPPEIDEITPSSARAGKTVDVSITGDFFPQEASLSVSGGINVLTYSVDSETEISATLEIPYSPSVVGAQTVTVSGPYGSGSGTFMVDSPGRPGIEIMTPDHGAAGTTVQVHIDGGNFRQGDTISVEGIPATMTVIDDGNINATFQIPPNAAPGIHNVLLSDPVFGGQSNPTPFTVTVPSPVINSVIPSPWQAGTSITVTIQGSGFGTDPDLEITDPAGLVTLLGWQGGDTLIQANVIVDGSAPAENALITVTPGFGEFSVHSMSSANRKSASAQKPTSQTTQTGVGNIALLTATASVPIVPAPAQPKAKITLFGNDVTGKTKSVLVGQKIALASTLSNLPSGVQVSQVAWTTSGTGGLPAGIANAGFDNGSGGAPSANTGKVETLQATSCTAGTSCNYNSFYWVDQGNGRTFTITYTLSSGAPVTATTTFDVKGPTGVTVQTSTNPVSVAHINDQNGIDLGLYVAFGNPLANKPGIKFTATATDSAGGTYQWVQLISGVTFAIQERFNSSTCKATDSQNNVVTSGNPALDSQYPYFAGASTSDSPGVALESSNKFWEVAETAFSANMYLMWIPPAPSGCSGVSCTIPVPLGSVPWSWSGEAVNKKGDPLANDWTTGCGSGGPANPTAPFQAGNTYPQWTIFMGGAFTGNTSPPKCTSP